MGLVSWLNRTFRTNVLSAPLAELAGGAEGVSVLHPIEVERSEGESSAPDDVPETPAATETTPSGAEPAPAEVGPERPDGSMASDMRDSIAQYSAENYVDEPEDEGYSEPTPPILRLANTIIQQGIVARASHIHIEPGARSIRIRYRIDGVLHEAMPMPKYLHRPLTNRYKVLAEIDMATHRGLPQEGRFPVRFEKIDYNLCVNSHPTRYGDYLTLHLYSIPRIQSGLDALGISPNVQQQVEWLIYRPYGLVLAVGPSRSGSTTTQYALLNHLNTTGVHIVSVEERVTYSLPWVTPFVADPRKGETMGSAIRTALRQDVDVVGIGDVRDKKTAQAAIEAAASCLVIATMHGNEALSALVRLAALGIDPGLIAATVQGVITQRRIRQICTHCKETYEVANRELRRFGFNPEDAEGEVTIARGMGCDYCRHTGYLDCIGLYELFQWDSTLINLFTAREALPRLKEVFAWNNRSDALKDDGLKKILAHVTTPEEVCRVL